jgi:hypothetical protein
MAIGPLLSRFRENRMGSVSIVIVGILAVSGSGGMLFYNHLLPHHSFETIVNGVGVALLACGLAVIHDGATGSRDILWMLPGQAGGTSAAPARAANPTHALTRPTFEIGEDRHLTTGSRPVADLIGRPPGVPDQDRAISAFGTEHRSWEPLLPGIRDSWSAAT